jgi:hypothetical protein
MRGIVIAPVIACGLLSAMVSFAGPASATSCHAASCVPNVAKNVAGGMPCTPSPSFVFGMDAQNGTLICAASGVWMPTGPLVGEAENSLPCSTPGTTAQERMAGDEWEVNVPGVPLQCSGGLGVSRWAHFPPG